MTDYILEVNDLEAVIQVLRDNNRYDAYSKNADEFASVSTVDIYEPTVLTDKVYYPTVYKIRLTQAQYATLCKALLDDVLQQRFRASERFFKPRPEPESEDAEGVCWM